MPLDDLLARAAKGDSNAQNSLGDVYSARPNSTGADNLAASWYRKAAEQGHVEAQFNLGMMFRKHRVIPDCPTPDWFESQSVEAQKWFALAANQGHANAQYQLGLMYSEWAVPFGEEMSALEQYRKREELTIGWIRNAAEQGSSEALSWLKRETQHGSAEAGFVLSSLYAFGKGVDCDESMALELLIAAATKGHIEAEYLLAEFYETGTCCEPNESQSIYWYSRAAEHGRVQALEKLRVAADKGIAGAQIALGAMYIKGNGLVQDDEEGFKWYCKAAETGVPEVQYGVAHMCLLGQGTPKSLDRAIEWYRKAAEQGHSDARRMLQALEFCPPPETCSRCGESDFNTPELSPNIRSAKWICKHCGKQETVLSGKNTIGQKQRLPIPKNIQREVWQRDQGKCVECGTNENLEFDHIIPIARGGADSVRNLQLLCMICNRRKSDKAPGAS